MPALLDRLTGGDRRSIGRADEVAEQVLREPRLFVMLWSGLHHADPLVRMRSADALEKVTARRPDRLAPLKKELLRMLSDTTQQEVRWHLLQMLPRLDLDPGDRKQAFSLAGCHLTDRSSIVKTSAMQAIADLSMHDETLRSRAVCILEHAMKAGTPAMRARGRKLLARLKKEEPAA